MTTAKTYLVTGARGFLGTALTARLRADGHTVRAGVSRPSTREGDYFCPLTASVSAWLEAIDGCDGIFHLAWSTVPGTANRAPLDDLETNLLGTVRLLDALKQRPQTRVLFASSGGTVYGAPQSIPITENHVLAPLGAYGAAKLSAETYVAVYRRQWGIDARVLRLSNPYGPGQNTNGGQGAASIFAARSLAGQPIAIWGTGEIVRDYVYIDDVIEAFVKCMNVDNSAFAAIDPVVNIGSGHGVSLNEIVATLESILRRKICVQYSPSRGFDVDVNVLDISRAAKLIGWRPVTDFKTGMTSTIEYLKEHVAISG